MIRLALGVAAIGLVIGALMPATDGPAPAGAANGGRVLEVAPPPQPTAAAVSGPWTTLKRADNGHFYARALVNGQSVEFVVDTGASGVSLTEADARRIGIPLDPASYTVVGMGASGEVMGQFVTFASVSLDGKSVEQVSGAVLQGASVSLLGQSFLSRWGRIEIAGETMTIR
ncbi:retropepsin-like aspartic protease family protein [Sphingomonas mesophila]|uniref:retropepsin-like aspartic protease family protein n=1 Tax=Sphingomonas mesophila TaxID=2303576 RepID=UPI000E573CC9|nr:TIGR02281 family clan AA aspartic protease [Sphingomonas mesophila]